MGFGKERENSNKEINKARRTERKLKRLAEMSIQAGKHEKALASIAACGNLLYRLNQEYTDSELEAGLLQISKALNLFSEGWAARDTPLIVFYDRFGLDVRGTAIMFLTSFLNNGFQVAYITTKTAKGNQPNISRLLDNPMAQVHYVDYAKGHLSAVRQLEKLFNIIQPSDAFFYSMPDDVDGIVVFNALKGNCTRYFSDLTDHAFWLGVNTFDYILNSREMGQGIQYYYRGIPFDKQLRNEVSLYIDHSATAEDLPFDATKYRYVFSGGSLYKTLGDSENAFYKIARHIVREHPDIVFLYAGSGDDREFNKLKADYPEQAFLIGERSDFYQLIEGCVLYLNTYPMFGGLMMRYAALAGKIPVTLVHGNDADGLLIRQEELKIEYADIRVLMDDVDRLLNDSDYRESREALLEGSVLTQDDMDRNIRLIITEHRSAMESVYDKPNTDAFRAEFAERFNYWESVRYSICKQNIALSTAFPLLFLRQAFCYAKAMQF